MKKVAIFQSDLRVGGIQKALINILNMIDYSKYCVDVYLFDDTHFFNLPKNENLNIIYNRAYPSINRIIYFNFIMWFAKSPSKGKEYDIAIDFSSYRSECAIGAIKANAKKRVMWVHNDVEIKRKYDFKYRVLWHFFKAKLKYYDEFVAVSPGIIDGFRRTTGLINSVITSVPNHIDTIEIFEKANAPTSFTVDENYYNLCTMGRMIGQKGFDILIDYISQAVKINKNIRLYIIGEGPDKNKLERQISRLILNDNVILLGSKKNPFPYLKKMDAFVLTSRYEGQGIVIREAKTLGLEIFISENLTKYNPGIQGTRDIPKALATAVRKEKVIDNLEDYNINIKESLENVLIENSNLKIVTKEQKKYDIILCGYYGFDNSGDDALLKSVIDTIRKYKKDIKFLVLSKKPKETAAEHNVDSINRSNFVKISSAMREASLFVYGGGSLIQDITSTRSLVYYTWLLGLAKSKGLKTMLYGNGIGPIEKSANIQRAKEALGICDYISLREPGSLAELKRLGIDTSNTLLTVDPALALEAKEVVDVLNIEGIKLNTNVYFVINCRSWKFCEPSFIDKLAKVIKETSAEYGLIPIYMPMHPNDNLVLKEVILKANTPYILLSKIYDVQTLMGIIKETKFVLSMRLHTLVYAVGVGIPIIGIEYDPKIKSFVEYAGQNTVLSTEDLNTTILKEHISNILKNYEQVLSNIREESKKLKGLSSQDAIAAIKLIGK